MVFVVKEKRVATRAGNDRKGMAIRAGHDMREKGESNKWWREGGVGSRAREGGKWALVMTAAIGTIDVVVGATILNSLITRVIFEEITLLNSGATMETLLIKAIITGVVQSTAKCPFPWH